MGVKTHILIVAGGDGKRMAETLPKQFLLLHGKPVLFHTFYSFLFLDDIEFTLVLNAKYIDYWKNLCATHGFNIPHSIAKGGPTRFHSVASGLKNIPPETLVLIHDAARPFASKKTISNVCKMAIHRGNAIPAVAINDTIREVYGSNNKIIDRDNLRAVQTPQGFNSSLIKTAYQQNYNPAFTDDASVVEILGHKINLVEGNEENIKISNSIDLVIADSIINSRAK